MDIESNKTEVFAIQILNDDEYLELRDKLLDLLPAIVSRQIERFKRSADEQRSLLGEVLSRKLLSQKAGTLLKEVEIIKSEKGKPIFTNISTIHFNISHSGNWVVCAISPSPVGIDVEKIKEPQYRIAERYFSEVELKSLNSISGEEKAAYFFDLWTLKESYLKMLGKGLTKSLGSFSISKKDGHFALTENHSKNKEVFLKQYPVETGYKLSVCSENEGFESNIQILDIKDLFTTYEI